VTTSRIERILRSDRTARLAAVALVLASPSLVGTTTPAHARSVAVAVDEEGGGPGASIALVDVRRPWRSRTGTVPIGRDSILRARGRLVYALSRQDGTLRVVDPHRGRTVHVVDLGAASAPEDLEVVSPRRVYVTRRNATRLLRVDPTSGAIAESTDLAPLADADGDPDLGAMLAHRGRLFVQVRRLSEEGPDFFAKPAQLAVVDLRDDTLVDADPLLAGVQGIALAGTPPKFKMQATTSPQRLFLSATGGFFDAGGIEAVDLATLRSLGLVLREDSGRAGADVGAFVMLRPDLGYLTFSTDLLLSSHLVRFVPGEVVSGELHVTLDYFVPAILHDGASRQLFLIDGGARPAGVFVFDAATGARATNEAIPTDGFPTDAVLIAGAVGPGEVEAIVPGPGPRLPLRAAPAL